MEEASRQNQSRSPCRQPNLPLFVNPQTKGARLAVI